MLLVVRAGLRMAPAVDKAAVSLLVRYFPIPCVIPSDPSALQTDYTYEYTKLQDI